MYGMTKNEDTNSENTLKYQSTWLWSFVFEWLESIVQSIVVIVLIMSFFFRIVNIVGESMMKTLHDGDKVVVFKWNYVPSGGDVVVIRRGQNLDEPLIKRVIATGGQTLSINFDDGSVTVDGKKTNEYYLSEKMWLQGDADIPSVIPEGYVFVMGDNRNHSLDSRFKEIGLIPLEDVLGKASYVLFPFTQMRSIN